MNYLRDTGSTALAKLLLIEQALMPYRSRIHNHKLYSTAQRNRNSSITEHETLIDVSLHSKTQSI